MQIPPESLNLRNREWHRILNTSDHDFMEDFFIPALSLSVKYDRGVGFFSSGWFRQAAKGLTQFAANGGKARWITSPILSETDWVALMDGVERNVSPRLEALLSSNINALENELEKDTLSAISWMICDGVIELKLACPKHNLSGEFHSKFGTFTDHTGNKLSFNGSFNDSLQGLLNYEEILPYYSWDETLNRYVEVNENRFERLWRNEDHNVRTYSLPEASKNEILKLRAFDRPYELSSDSQSDTQRIRSPNNPLNRFQFPSHFNPRAYQKNAIRAWLNAGGKGILEMATGSGKTFTSLYAAKLVAEKKKPLVLLIVCPYINLATQWSEELSGLGVSCINCYEGRNKWQNALQSAYSNLHLGITELLPIVTTNATFTSAIFQNSLNVSSGIPHMIIADEVHNLGAEKLGGCLSDEIDIRLGLSATPERHMDEEGTRALFDYFGEPVFKYSIKEAIADGYLTKYYYHPILVELTPHEAQEYWRISKRISRTTKFDSEGNMSDALKYLLLERANLLAIAENKIPRLKEIITELEGVEFRKALVYCGVGSREDDNTSEMVRNIDSVTSMLSELELKIARFTCEESRSRRDSIINQLKSDEIDGIVAIRCMDEGIDIPSAAIGFILASSTNSRQIVQRRGRLLRKAEGKSYAHIYDFIVKPPDLTEYASDGQASKTERSLFKRELKRIIEFCDDALNGPQALNSLQELRVKYNLVGYDGN